MDRNSDSKIKRLLVVTPGNLRNSHLYIRKHIDFFPADCVGSSRKSRGGERDIEIALEGMGEIVTTDIGTNAQTGKPRGFFRGRKWVREFFDHHSVSAGDILALERLGSREYRLSVEKTTAGTDRNYRFAEFFAGIGLMRIGLEQADPRWECTFANDLDDTKRRIYAGHFGCSVDDVDGTDVHLLSKSEVPTVDLATASFPCTDLSVAGGRAGIRSGESSAFWGFHRVLKEMGRRRPPLVLLENVVGFLTSDGGRDFRDALLALNSLGYKVDPFILDARWFVPQSRQRMFVVGVRNSLADGVDGSGVTESRVRPSKLTTFIAAHRNEIDWSIRDLPEPPLKSDRTLRNIIQNPPHDHNDWWDRTRVDYLYNQMFPRHQEWVDTNRHAPKYQYATAFRRVRPQGDGTKRSMAELRMDGIAGCLRTPKGGSGRQILVRSGRGRFDARLLSAIECASLMGADGYRMVGTLNQALFGFGDAVCVDAVTWIAQHYLLPVLQLAEASPEPYAGTNGRTAKQAAAAS